jgi:hypothetical protein
MEEDHAISMVWEMAKSVVQVPKRLSSSYAEVMETQDG